MPAVESSTALADGTLLRISGLGKRFGSNWVFRNLDFHVSTGQALIVLGRNGSGKSTLLKCLAGLLTPTEGQINTAIVEEGSDLSMSALEQSVYPYLSAREHLDLFARLRGCAARTDELLEKVGLSDAGDRFGSQLSTGMKSRLKLALAIQPRPKLLLLDEPGAAMDESGKDLVLDICREQRERGALIVATNDPAEKRFGTHELELK